jgi:hypothetical protein
VRPRRGDIQGEALRGCAQPGFSAAPGLYTHLMAACVQELQKTRIGDVHGNICTRKALRAHPPAYRTLAPRDTITGALIIEHIGLVLPQAPPPDSVVRFTPVVTTHAPSRELLSPSSTDHDKHTIFEITISTHKRYESAHSTILYLQQAACYSEGVCRNEAAFSIYQWII